MSLASLRHAIRQHTHADEHFCVEQLLNSYSIGPEQEKRAIDTARELVKRCRNDKHGKGLLDAFLLEFGLSNKEGVVLMCLAEALLRIPDTETADRLIAEKLRAGNWGSHRGQSDSLFVNASVWGLMLTGNLVTLDPETLSDTGHWVQGLAGRLGEPVVRKAVLQAMKIMGKQYVLGQTIDEGLARGAQSNPPGTRFSFDVLGEGARTDKDALRYFKSYCEAIDTIGKASDNTDIHAADGISVKLSALHPRYHYSHREQVMAELLPRIRELAIKASAYNIGLSIDAEESDRLDISMDIFEALAFDPELSSWDGLGFVLQAYLKRSPLVADWLIELAKVSGHRLLVRLVKGAYWDAEIKHAQEQGLADYPVYTRKVNSDLCYLVCAEKLFAATAEIYPQFATHNAQTAAQILTMAGNRDFEFQRLHGMGLQLYHQLQKIKPGAHFPLRLYAPVGQHKDLLPYLVRRLLENGANSSFVNRFLDEKIPVNELIVAIPPQVKAIAGYRHKQIPLPEDMLIASGEQRRNARGIDLNNPLQVGPLLDEIAAAQKLPWRSGPIVAGNLIEREMTPVLSPTDHRVVAGETCKPLEEDIEQALTLASGHQPDWDAAGGEVRAECLERMADLLEEDCEQLMGLISLEGGRTLDDTLSEVREAVDFCRYYALQARINFGPQSTLNLEGRGVFLCISPWNFPLAIFTGQIAAALAAGNAVLAKPANPTTLIAARTVQLFHQAGIPVEILHLVPGRGSQLGGQLIPDARLSGIALTGSTETAQMINRQLAQRPGPVVPMIAETGGQNAMLVDSTALPEQLVDDVIASAFLSAGQRCSALRILFLQEDVADNILDMLRGALQTYSIGDPSLLSTDVGPVIDRPSQRILLDHIERMNTEAKLIAAGTLESIHAEGTFVAPHVFEIESLEQLPEEVFGPVLHVIRYAASDLDKMLEQIRNTGYGLTLGIHSRLEAFARHVFNNTQVGNTYVNRNMVGAVVGVNPFGGHGLSGTGPKAGGPHYLFGFAREKVLPLAEIITSGEILLPEQNEKQALHDPLGSALQKAKDNQPLWDRAGVAGRAKCIGILSGLLSPGNEHGSNAFVSLANSARRYLEPHQLPGPTGEHNELRLSGRGVFLYMYGEQTDSDSIALQLATALVSGCAVIALVPPGTFRKTENDVAKLIAAGIPAEVISVFSTDEIPISASLLLDSRLAGFSMDDGNPYLQEVKQWVARRDGPLVPLLTTRNFTGTETETGFLYPLSRHFHERTWTENLVARGGNTALFTLEE